MGTGNTVTVIAEGMYSTITVSAGQQTTGSIIGRGSAHTQRIGYRQNIAHQVILVAGNTTGRVHHGGNVTRLVIAVVGHATGTISHRNHLGSGIIGERTSTPLVIADALHTATGIPGVEHRRSHTGTGNGQHTTACVIANACLRTVTVHLANQSGISVVLVTSHRLLSSTGSLIGCSQSTARIIAVLGHTTRGGNHAYHLVRTVVLVAAQTALSVQYLHGVTCTVINHRGDSRVVSICANLRARILGENLAAHRAAQVVTRDTHAVNTIVSGEGLARGINRSTYTHAGRVNQCGQSACGIILASPHTTGGVNGADQAHQTIVGVAELRTTRQGNAVNIAVRIKGTLHTATQRVNHCNNVTARTVLILGASTGRIHRSHQATTSSVLKTPAGAIRILTAHHVTGRIIGELSLQPKSRNNLHQVSRSRVLATGQLLLSITNTGQQTELVILKGDGNTFRAHHALQQAVSPFKTGHMTVAVGHRRGVTLKIVGVLVSHRSHRAYGRALGRLLPRSSLIEGVALSLSLQASTTSQTGGTASARVRLNSTHRHRNYAVLLVIREEGFSTLIGDLANNTAALIAIASGAGTIAVHHAHTVAKVIVGIASTPAFRVNNSGQACVLVANPQVRVGGVFVRNVSNAVRQVAVANTTTVFGVLLSNTTGRVVVVRHLNSAGTSHHAVNQAGCVMFITAGTGITVHSAQVGTTIKGDVLVTHRLTT
ncbi:Uncharacterised protein [Mycobacterium tuberculosis]|nr:Uncharacterised protein [Mycobacterium tuberculosis]